MNFTSIFTAIVTFIRLIPEIIKIVRQVLDLARDYSDKKEMKQKAEDVAKAIKTARETKDTGDLEKMFGQSFDITFKTEEKKSLDFGALSLEVKLDDKKRLAQQVEELIKEEPSSLKKIEAFVNDSQDLLPEDPKPEEPKKAFGFFSFGRSSDVTLGSSFVNNVYMSGSPRMGSKFLVFALLILSIGCKEEQAINQPNYKPALYAGDSANGGISRKQTGEFIRASDPKFDDYVSMKYSTLACIHKTYIANCREYKQEVVNCDTKNVSFVKDLVKSR